MISNSWKQSKGLTLNCDFNFIAVDVNVITVHCIMLTIIESMYINNAIFLTHIS